MNQGTIAKLKILTSMFIFGTIGVFVRYIPLPSSLIALVRGIVGVVFLLLILCVQRKRLDWSSVRANLIWLLFSGAALGFNWILLFESYRYTSVAVSTLCYYMAPILVILLAPLILKEAMTGKKLLCVCMALLGMICISGILQSGSLAAGEITGICFGLAAAVLYASMIMLNKQISGISPYDKTILQLGISAFVLLPYCLMTVEFSQLSLHGTAAAVLVLVGVLHTGVTYLLYFGSLDYVSGQTAAMISYVDPVVAVLLSVIVLKEPLHAAECVGAVLILGAALLSELSVGRKSNT